MVLEPPTIQLELESVMIPRPRAAVLFVEFQREWLDPAVGKLYPLVQDRAQLRTAVVAGARGVSLTRQHEHLEAVHVPCAFRPGYPELGRHAHGLFAAIPRAGTWSGAGAGFAPQFAPAIGGFVVDGRVGASAFAHSDLDLYLRHRGIRNLYPAGFALHVCIESTLRHGHDLGYDVTVLSDACAAFTSGRREHTLQHTVHHFGRSLGVDELLRDSSSPHPGTHGTTGISDDLLGHGAAAGGQEVGTRA